eukprot:7377283-Prymnesium_polylepis.1
MGRGRPLALRASPVGAAAVVFVVGLGALPAVSIGNGRLRETCGVDEAPEVAIDSLPAGLLRLGDRGLLLVLRHVQHELARTRVDQRPALDRVLQRMPGHIAVAVARALALVLDQLVAAASDAASCAGDCSEGSGRPGRGSGEPERGAYSACGRGVGILDNGGVCRCGGGESDGLSGFGFRLGSICSGVSCTRFGGPGGGGGHMPLHCLASPLGNL